MEYSAKGQRNILLFAIISLLVIILTLILSTWQVLQQQEKAGIQHLAMTGRSIAQTLENTLRRQWRLEGLKSGFWSRMNEFFSSLEANSDVLFIEIIDERGLRIVAARQGRENPLRLSKEQFGLLMRNGEWHGVAGAEDEQGIFIYASRLRPLDWPKPPDRLPGAIGAPAPGLPPTPDGSISEQKMPDYRPDGERHKQLLPSPRPSFMIVGLSMAGNQGLYDNFRNSALLQSAYIMVVAVFLWGLAVSLIARRAALGKAKVLERFQAELLDNLPDGLITVSMDNEIQAANPAAHALLGNVEGEIAGSKLDDLPDDFRKALGSIALSEEGIGWQQTELGGRQLEILLSSYSGENDEPVRLLLMRDRTRLHNLERSLAEAEKMAAIGILAAGVAHEIRNPLSALRGFAQYFSKKFAGRKPDEDYANTMVREADRLNRVITDLLYLARNKSAHPLPVDINKVVREVAELLRFDLFPKGTALDLDLRAPVIQADADAVKQALLNLMINSQEALAEKEEQLPAGSAWLGRIWVRAFRREDWVVLEVEDNGSGMTEEQKKRAFEAFFTSKAKGTGLGLSLVNKTVRELGGKAIIDSVRGEGCKVSLFFPV